MIIISHNLDLQLFCIKGSPLGRFKAGSGCKTKSQALIISLKRKSYYYLSPTEMRLSKSLYTPYSGLNRAEIMFHKSDHSTQVTRLGVALLCNQPPGPARTHASPREVMRRKSLNQKQHSDAINFYYMRSGPKPRGSTKCGSQTKTINSM